MSFHTERERLRVIGAYALAVLLGYLVFQLFRPFLVPLAWAGVLVICFYPTHCRIKQRLRPGRAALVSTTLVALLVIVPMLVVSSAFLSEAARMLQNVPAMLAQAPAFVHRWLQAALVKIPGGETVDIVALLTETAQRLASFLTERAAGVLQDAAAFIAYLVITIFAMFFLFRDAPSVMRGVRYVLPVEPELRERLIAQTRSMVTASVTSSLIVATVQGVLGGLAFWVLGLKAPVFWGVIMGFFCLVPLGAWVVWAPAAVWLALTGHVTKGLLLAGIGFAIVSSVDNVLRPILLSDRSEMNGLLLFVSLLGGIGAFGTVGLVLGPVLMAIAVGLFQAYTAEPSAPAAR